MFFTNFDHIIPYGNQALRIGQGALQVGFLQLRIGQIGFFSFFIEIP